MKLCVIGLWHLGTVTSACLAELGYSVVGVDPDHRRIEGLNHGQAPLFEPGLDDLLARNLAAGRLCFTTEMATGAAGASYAIIALDTPVDEQDEADLSGIFEAGQALGRCLEEDTTVIVSSQVPVGTCQRLAEVIRDGSQRAIGIACVPENLRLGQAIQRFMRPEFLVLGADSPAVHERLERLYAPIDAPKLRMNLRSAEMTKHAINAFLAITIGLINELANLSDMVGADAFQVAQALRLDSRIGPGAPIHPGLGFGGGTLARDMKVLRRLALEHGYNAALIEGVLQANERQNRMVVSRLKSLYSSLRDLSIGVLGLTYKPGTSTLRRSPALEIIRDLAAEGAHVKAYDPKAEPQEVAHYRRLFTPCADAYSAAAGSEALVLLTAWPEFRELDFPRIRDLLKRPVLLDAQNILDPDALSQMGFLYQGVGRSRLSGRAT